MNPTYKSNQHPPLEGTFHPMTKHCHYKQQLRQESFAFPYRSCRRRRRFLGTLRPKRWQSRSVLRQKEAATFVCINCNWIVCYCRSTGALNSTSRIVVGGNVWPNVLQIRTYEQRMGKELYLWSCSSFRASVSLVAWLGLLYWHSASAEKVRARCTSRRFRGWVTWETTFCGVGRLCGWIEILSQNLSFPLVSFSWNNGKISALEFDIWVCFGKGLKGKLFCRCDKIK